MRNALVVLVPVCIGLTSGFIVPSRIQEVWKTNEIRSEKILRTNVDSEKHFTSTMPNEVSALKRVFNNILDKDLYEHIIEKNFNLTERSFIYIKNEISKNIKEHVSDKNVGKFYLLKAKDIFDEVHRRYSGRVDKNNLKARLFNDSGHRCKGQSDTIKYNDDNKGKGHENFRFFGIPVTLNVLENNKKESNSIGKLETKVYTEYFTKASLNNHEDFNKFETRDNYPKNKIDKSHFLDYKSIRFDEVSKLSDYVIGNDQFPKEKNYTLYDGFRFCHDCTVNGKKHILNNRVLVEIKCKCGYHKDDKGFNYVQTYK